MKRAITSIFLLSFLAVAAFVFVRFWHNDQTTSTPSLTSLITQRVAPKRVGLQIGHKDIADVPDEFHNISWDFGVQVGSVTELDVNSAIANDTAALLRGRGYQVDILDSTVPIGYKADAFVAIHADGNDDSSVYGYKVASSSFDASTNSDTLAKEIIRAYGDAVGFARNPTITTAMTQYYSFNYQKFQHTISPTTPGVIVEAGFLTNSTDRAFLVAHPDVAAQGIAQGIIDYFNHRAVSDVDVATNIPQPGS